MVQHVHKRGRIPSVVGLVIAVVGAVALAGLMWGRPAAATALPTGADADAIRGVVTSALRLLQEESLPPSAYQGGPISDQIRGQMTSRAMAQANDLFSGPGLDWFEGVVNYNLDEQASGEIRHLGGGVSRIEFSAMSIVGETATVTAVEDIWADIAQIQDSGTMAIAHPMNTLLVSVLLQRNYGRWYVTNYRAKFAPGSEP